MVKKSILLILVIILLPGCINPSPPDVNLPPNVITSPASPTYFPNKPTPYDVASITPGASVTHIPGPSPTPSTTPPPLPTHTLTKSATVIEAILPFPTPAINSRVKQQCLDIKDTIPEYVNLAGTIILNSKLLDPNWEGEVYMMDLQSGEKRLMPKGQGQVDLEPYIFTISPDRKWFYYFSPSTSGTGSQLHIRSIDGQERHVAYWNETWGESVDWLDNNRMAIYPYRRGDPAVGTVIILDPDTGKWQTIAPDFASGLNFDFPVVYYNPSLTRAVYLSGKYYVLKDVISQQDIWKKEGWKHPLPGWSPNGSNYSMIVTTYLQSDLYMIDQNGVESRLTDLSDAYPSFPKISVDYFSWSPNGKYIAFLLNIADNTEYEGPTLAVINVTTSQVIDYCIVVSGGVVVWSPDGDQLMISSPVDVQEYMRTHHTAMKQHMRVIWVDLERGLAAQIAKETAVAGWMVEP